MAFRGYFALNGVEFANSSRVLEHIGKSTPTTDLIIGGLGDSCGLTLYEDDLGLAYLPDSSAPLYTDSGLGTPPDGSMKYDEGLLLVGDCWRPSGLCGCATMSSVWNDTWPGLQDYLQDTIYRPELAPWFVASVPQSGEFGGVWVMDAKGFGPPPADRQVVEMIGSGATNNPHRDGSRKLTFDALLVACTNAGLEYGLNWLNCQLRQTIEKDGVLRYFTGHPNSSADPSTLIRELRGVIMTQAPTITQSINSQGRPNQQATMYRVQFELTAQNPYAWHPPIHIPVVWDTITTESIEWAHRPDCGVPSDCAEMLGQVQLFSETCPPEIVPLSTANPPPICGGCLPVSGVDRYKFFIPTFDLPAWCQDTVVSIVVTNHADSALTLQAYLKACSIPEDCASDRFPVQINGLPKFCSITLDGVDQRYTATRKGKPVTPMGIVGTPNGVPWRPPVLNRTDCWQFEVLAPPDADFDIDLVMYDREA